MEVPPPFVGGIYHHAFWFYKRRTFRNSFTPVLYGRIVEKDGIVKLQGLFALHPVLMIMAAGLMLYALCSGQTIVMFVVCFFVILGVPLFLAAAADQQDIQNFLREHL